MIEPILRCRPIPPCTWLYGVKTAIRLGKGSEVLQVSSVRVVRQHRSRRATATPADENQWRILAVGAVPPTTLTVIGGLRARVLRWRLVRIDQCFLKTKPTAVWEIRHLARRHWHCCCFPKLTRSGRAGPRRCLGLHIGPGPVGGMTRKYRSSIDCARAESSGKLQPMSSRRQVDTVAVPPRWRSIRSFLPDSREDTPPFRSMLRRRCEGAPSWEQPHFLTLRFYKDEASLAEVHVYDARSVGSNRGKEILRLQLHGPIIPQASSVGGEKMVPVRGR